MGKKGPLWWRESDWLLRGSSAANQILLRHSGPILSNQYHLYISYLWQIFGCLISNIDDIASNHPRINDCGAKRCQELCKILDSEL